MNIYNAKNNSMPEQVLENKENIELLNTGKQDTLIAGENITIDENNVISASGASGDIVIYENENGENEINDIALEMGAIYEIFITSAFDGPTKTQYGQRKITIKLIPAEDTPDNYDLYMPVHYFETATNSVYSTFIHIYKYETELWSVSINVLIMKIYKIIKKAV